MWGAPQSLATTDGGDPLKHYKISQNKSGLGLCNNAFFEIIIF